MLRQIKFSKKIGRFAKRYKFSKQPCFAKRRIKLGAIKNSAKSASETAFLRAAPNLAAKDISAKRQNMPVNSALAPTPCWYKSKTDKA